MYDFLHWETIETPILAGGILAAFTMVYMGICLIDERLKWKLVSNRDEKMRQAIDSKKKK
jgi:hypothetical protein